MEAFSLSGEVKIVHKTMYVHTFAGRNSWKPSCREMRQKMSWKIVRFRKGNLKNQEEVRKQY